MSVNILIPPMCSLVLCASRTDCGFLSKPFTSLPIWSVSVSSSRLVGPVCLSTSSIAHDDSTVARQLDGVDHPYCVISGASWYSLSGVAADCLSNVVNRSSVAFRLVRSLEQYL